MASWNEILDEIERYRRTHFVPPEVAIDYVRRRYLRRLFNYTKRNIITYYSAFQTKPGIFGLGIEDGDKNGLMMAVHKMDRTLGLDLFLHTPGGEAYATESIVNYLRQMFGTDIRAIVPLQAMSAGTMIACACKIIVLGKQSALGPIDPQLQNVPAHGVINEFQTAYQEISADVNKLHVWRPIIEKYHPTFLSQCQNAIKWSEEFARKALITGMFNGEEDGPSIANSIISSLTNYTENGNHNRHIHVDACVEMGLKIYRLEDDQIFQDLVLSVHHPTWLRSKTLLRLR